MGLVVAVLLDGAAGRSVTLILRDPDVLECHESRPATVLHAECSDHSARRAQTKDARRDVFQVRG